MINDPGVAPGGAAGQVNMVDSIVADVTAKGGVAMAHRADISRCDDVADMVDRTIEKRCRIDIVVNNTGIPRDRAFAKMSMNDFRKVADIHLIGSTNVTHARWPTTQDRKYGRVLLTSSASGLYGNFRRSNNEDTKEAMMRARPKRLQPPLQRSGHRTTRSRCPTRSARQKIRTVRGTRAARDGRCL